MRPARRSISGARSGGGRIAAETPPSIGCGRERLGAGGGEADAPRCRSRDRSSRSASPAGVSRWRAIARGAGGAGADMLLVAIDAEAGEQQRPRAEPACGQFGDEQRHRIGERGRDRLGGGDRLDEAEHARWAGGRRRSARSARLAGRAPDRAGRAGWCRSGGRAARAGRRSASPIVSMPRRRAASICGGSSRSAAGGSGASASASPPGSHSVSGVAAMAGERVRRAGGARHRDPRGEAEPCAEAQDAPRHRPLAAEQMGDAGEIEPQPVARRPRLRRSASSGGRRTSASRSSTAASAAGVGIAHVEPRHQRARLRQRHAGGEAERAGGGAGGGDHHARADRMRGDERGQARRRVAGGGGAARSCVPVGADLVGPHDAERVPDRFAAPAEFAHRRALVERQRVDLGLLRGAAGGLAAAGVVPGGVLVGRVRRRGIVPRPARAGPPAAAARAGAGGGIVVADRGRGLPCRLSRHRRARRRPSARWPLQLRRQVA